MKSKMMKKILAGALVLVIASVGFISMPRNTEAESGEVVKAQKTEYADFETYIDAQKPPKYTLTDTENVGYLFGGWYKDETLTEPISAKGDVAVNTEVYAKFIPSYLTGIACQVDVKAGSDTRNLRIVSLVHSEYYSAVGFNVHGRYDADGDGINETEWLMYSQDTDAAETDKLFTGLYEYSKDGSSKRKRTPTDVFGADAEGFYFTTVSITGIGVRNNIDFKDATMAVTPYWITLDGTYVEGMGEFNRVNDYEDGIINVSVNLKNATDIAVGMINVTCPEGFTLVEGECGRVFEEMECAQRGTLIRCVGNVEEATNSTTPNEVYVNLRLKAEGTVTLGANKFAVSIPDNGFCNIDEEVQENIDAWNVKY